MIERKQVITLEQFIIQTEKSSPGATGEFSQVIRDIVLASRMINREVNKAGLVDILGVTGEVNVQGEEVKILDIFSNEHMIEALKRGGQVCLIGSEENEEVIPIESSDGKYVVLMDPLDGSSNIDVNVSIGTIFSIYKRVSADDSVATLEDALQKGCEQVAAGYILYGSSTMLVYTTGNGVNGFTLDPSIGEFLLSHRDLKYPKVCKTYSINEGNYAKLFRGVKEYLRYIKKEDQATNRPYSARYIGSLVADFHRNLLRGGIFMYPATTNRPAGKLRLLFEGNPMAFLTEQAGGRATDGTGRRILDIKPEKLHQRIPLFMGNSEEVLKLEEFIKEYETKLIIQ